MIQDKEKIKSRIDSELKNITTDNIHLDRIFEERISIIDRIKNILDREVEIPVGAFIFALCVSLTFTLMINLSKMNITETEIANSKIKIFELKDGSIWEK